MAYIPKQPDLERLNELLQKIKTTIDNLPDKSEKEKKKLLDDAYDHYTLTMFSTKYPKPVYLSEEEHNELIEIINDIFSQGIKEYWEDTLVCIRKEKENESN